MGGGGGGAPFWLMAAIGLWLGTEEASGVLAAENEVRMGSPFKVEETGNKRTS